MRTMSHPALIRAPHDQRGTRHDQCGTRHDLASKTCVPAKKPGEACTAIEQCQDFARTNAKRAPDAEAPGLGVGLLGR